MSFAVQSPEQAREAATRSPTPASAPAPHLRLVETMHSTETSTRDLPLVRQLQALHAQGAIEPCPVTLGPMPATATIPMKAIADEIALRLGLLQAEGVTRALPYALSEAVAAGVVVAKASAGWALGRLCNEGVIRCVGEMPKLGKGNGTKLYVPPSWWPADPTARAVVAATGRHDQAADLVWIPDAREGADHGCA